MRISKFILFLSIISLLFTYDTFAQEASNKSQESTQQENKILNPIDTVKEFYRLLREKKYLEGFRLSVYRDAIEPLTAEELKELEPDFEATFSRIPETVKAVGSQSTGALATVFIKSTDNPKDPTAEEIPLMLINNHWVVGDAETLELVKSLGTKFFPEIRIRAHEDAAQIYMERYIGAQKLYSDANKGLYGSIDDLVTATFWPPSLKNGQMEGYKFTIEIGKDKREFWVHGEPLTYGKSGRVSFYADLNGVYRLDNGGQVFRGPQSLGNGK
ncbi:MAG: hypothetical protein HY819_19355 [Acidobacteria bacterium]|nr:hypothetical protein [Acidobacteriota bacterium]